MNSPFRWLACAATTALLASCASIPGPSPVEVTRFHDVSALSEASGRSVFVSDAPSSEESGLSSSAYKRAVASELNRLGFAEAGGDAAGLIAEVRLERFQIAAENRRRGPVDVGVGGSTGSYGSGVGLGIGINLGGGGSGERVGTELGVMLKDKSTGKTVWEGRAQFTVSPKSELAAADRNAQIIAEAMFREFPGNNGETIEVEVAE